MTLRNFLLYAVLLAAAIGSYLIATDTDDDNDIRVDRHLASTGYYMLDAEIRGFGTDGNFLYRLQANEIAEDMDTGVVRLLGVNLQYRDGADVPWRLTATAGELTPDGMRLELTGDVEATNESGSVPTTLKTSALTVDPQRYELSTEARVNLRVGERSISATGMLAFLNEDRIEFRSNVNGKFLP
ncbi:MAG: LPS export ABC transporter periplasmic protein LptC [Pseudomonadota bacterium]